MSIALEFLLERGFNPNITNNIEELLDRKQSETSKGNNTSIAIPKENIAIPSKTIAIPSKTIAIQIKIIIIEEPINTGLPLVLLKILEI